MTIEVFKDCLMSKFDDLSLQPGVQQEEIGKCELNSCQAYLRLCTDGLTEVVNGICANMKRVEKDMASFTPSNPSGTPIFNATRQGPLL